MKDNHLVITEFDLKNNQNIILDITQMNTHKVWFLSIVLNLMIEYNSINDGLIESLIKDSSEISDEPIQPYQESIDELLKCITRQISNYESYMKQTAFFQSKNKLNVLKFLSLTAFQLTKGHYLVNGNKRFAFMFLFKFLAAFGFKPVVQDWKYIYKEWKEVASIDSRDQHKAVDKIYKIVLHLISKRGHYEKR